jgi:hypothetical protein
MPIIVLLVLAIPWLVLYLLPVKPSFRIQVLIALIFYSLSGLSIAIRMGQPTILMIFLLVLTLVFIRQGRKVLPGIIFGLALSKITFAVPLLLYLVYKRRWSVVIMGLGVQILGLLALALLVDVSPLTLYTSVSSMPAGSAAASFINLIHLAGHVPHDGNAFYGFGIAFSILVFGVVWWWVFRHKVKAPTPELWDYALLAVLNLWGLLAAFHHQYDSGVGIFGIALLITAVSQPNVWELSSSQTKWLTGLTVVGLIGIVVLPPGLSYTQFLYIWAPIRWKMMTIGPLLLLVACIWLWRQGTLRAGMKT